MVQPPLVAVGEQPSPEPSVPAWWHRLCLQHRALSSSRVCCAWGVSCARSLGSWAPPRKAAASSSSPQAGQGWGLRCCRAWGHGGPLGVPLVQGQCETRGFFPRLDRQTQATTLVHQIFGGYLRSRGESGFRSTARWYPESLALGIFGENSKTGVNYPGLQPCTPAVAAQEAAGCGPLARCYLAEEPVFVAVW